jgi:hypothetical protein
MKGKLNPKQAEIITLQLILIIVIKNIRGKSLKQTTEKNERMINLIKRLLARVTKNKIKGKINSHK